VRAEEGRWEGNWCEEKNALWTGQIQAV